MKKGDLLRLHNSGGMAIVVSDVYHKSVWGSSGHPEDIKIVSMIDIKYMHNGFKKRRSLSYIIKHYEVISRAKKD